MLPVIVVHKVGDMQPGPGFFQLAKKLGRDTSDILVCWIDQLKTSASPLERGEQPTVPDHSHEHQVSNPIRVH